MKWLANVFRQVANKLDSPPSEVAVEVSDNAEDDTDEHDAYLAAPAVILSPEAEAMLADARMEAAVEGKAEPDGPAEGSAWYRMLLAGARREK